MDRNDELRGVLQKLLDWEDAHAGFDSAVEGVPPEVRVRSQRDYLIRSGNSWSICESASATSLISASIPITRSGNSKITGQALSRRPRRTRGIRAFPVFAPIASVLSSLPQIAASISLLRSLMAAGRLTCASCYSLPIIMLITLGNSLRLGDSLALGSRK